MHWGGVKPLLVVRFSNTRRMTVHSALWRGALSAGRAGVITIAQGSKS